MKSYYKMGCAMGFIKYVMFIFNLIFTIIGLALVILATLFVAVINNEASMAGTDVDSEAISEAITQVIIRALVLTIVIGVIVFVTSFLGCCGAIKENQFMLKTYAIILLVIFVVQLASGIYSLTNIGKVQKQIEIVQEKVASKFMAASIFNDTDSVAARDYFQSSFQCCGAYGPDIYGASIPGSCCPTSFEPCPSANNDYYREGCVSKMHEVSLFILEVIGSVIIGTAVAELIGVVFGLSLANSIGKIRYRRHLDAL